MKRLNYLLLTFLSVITSVLITSAKETDKEKSEAITQIIERIQLPEIGSAELKITDFGANNSRVS